MSQVQYTDAQIWDFICFLLQLTRTSRRSVRAVLDRCPPCHFFALERLHMTIVRHGHNGAIYMGDLAAALRDSPQSASRSIRILELDGLAERAPDPADRRRTLVRLTALGEKRRHACEAALRDYMRAVWTHMGSEHGTALLREARLFEQSLAAVAPCGPPGPAGDIPAGGPIITENGGFPND